MAFPVTDAPILIDVSGVGHSSRQSGSEVNPMGPFLNGTNLYVVFSNATDLDIRIFKSTDGGATWTIQNAAGSPDPGTIDAHSINVFYDDSAKVIYVSYLITAVNRKVVAFDTNTDTYAAPIVWGFATTIFFERTAVLIRQLTGVLQLFYSDNSSGNINYITLTGSTPSGPTLLVNLAGGKRDVDAGIQDASGAIHISYGQDPGTRSYIRLDSSLTVTSGPTSFGNNDGFRADVIITSDSRLVFAWTDFSTILVEISPSLTVPVWTKYTVATNMTGGDFSYASLAEDNSNNLLAFWAYVSNGDMIDEIQSSTFDGVSTWAAPVLFYDEITNPPADAEVPPSQFIHTGEVKQLADDTWLYITAMETVIPTGCTGFALRIPGTPPTGSLTLQKTVVGGNSNASDFFVQATGNNNAISGFGTATGNVETGVFQLSESGPIGVTWANANTTWANANTTWNGGFGNGVWNCGPAFMPTANSVFVPPPGNTAVVPVQVSSNASYEAGTTDPSPYYAEIGANLYQVLYSPKGTPPGRIGMFTRATASVGNLWSELDAIHSPDKGSQSGRFEFAKNGTTISVAYLKNGFRSLVICTFNTTTGLWGTPGAVTVVPQILAKFVFVQRSDATYVVIGIWASQLYYLTNIAGVWSFANVLSSGGLIMGQGFIDPSDNIYFQIQPENIIFNSTDNTVPLVRVSSSYVTTYFPILSSLPDPDAARTQYPGGAYPYSFFPSIVLWSSGTKIAIADLAPDNFIHVKIVTSITTTPVFTNYSIYGPGATETVTYYLLVEGLDGKLNLFFVSANTVGPVHRIMHSVFSGTAWSTPAVFYDAVTNPPSNGDVSAQVISALSAVDLVAGWTLAASLATQQSPTAPTGQFIESVTAGSSVVCVITNTFGPPVPPPPVSGTCRTILHLWQLAASPQVEITTDRASDWNNGGHEGNKFYQGLKLDADTFGQPKTLMIRDADTGTLHALQPGVVNHSGRQVIPYSFQQPFSAHMVKDEPQDMVPWRKFGVTYVYELTPESVQTWITQFTAHGLKGYQHIARIEAAYASQTNVTLTITSYDGTSPAPITLPPTGGAYQKLLLTLTMNKGQLYRYAAQSSGPFQLYLDDWIVWVGMWGRADAYLPYRNLGGNFGDKATI